MAVTAKHFPTHAGAHIDSHLEFAVDNRELAALDEDLQPYRDLIRNGLPAVMVAHVSFPQIDERPASLSSWWIDHYLRGELDFFFQAEDGIRGLTVTGVQTCALPI